MTRPVELIKDFYLTNEAAALVMRLLLPIVGGAVVAMTVASLVAQPIWGDQSWLLYAASRVLDGGRIGTDIVDVNPPTIIWLSEIPVALSHLFGVLPQTAMKICLGLLLFLSAAWCASMVRRIPRAGSSSMAMWLAIGIAYATTVYSWAHVGQREYIMVLLLLPYLVTVALRLDGVSPAAWQGFVAGAIAVVGFSMKPQHILMAVGVEILLAWCNGLWRSLVRPEAVGAMFAGLVYAAAVAIFAPDYVTKVMPLAYRAYLGYTEVPLLALLEPRRMAKFVALLLLYAATRRRLEYRALSDVFAIAAVGATIGYLIQRKGWQYQFVPAQTFSILLVGVILVDGFIQFTASLQRKPFRAGIIKATALVSFLLVGLLYYPIQTAKAAADVDKNRVAVQQSILAALPAGATIAVLGPNYASIFDFILDDNLRWGERFLGFWTLEVIFNAETAVDRKVRQQQLAQLTDVVQWTRAAADEDLRRWKPNLVLVERCADPTISCGTSESLREVDALQWLREDSAFKADWANYERCRQIGYYDIWYLRQDEKMCDAVTSIAAN
jgi:hypothetical protein